MGVASVPLLFETHREGDFDFVAVTVCPPELQLQRILERDRISEEEARQRIAAQMPAEQKAQRADFVILTGGTPLATDRQVDELLIAMQQLPYVVSGFSRTVIGRLTRRAPPVPSRARSDLPQTCSTHGSAGTATAAQCCDSGIACRCADPCKTRRGA